MTEFRYNYNKRDILAPARQFITDHLLVLDIETTGLSPNKNMIYCIGLGYQDEGRIQVHQLFAETLEEEAEILSRLNQISRRFSQVLTFNGTTFDLPFLRRRSAFHGISCGIDHLRSLDLYREAMRIRRIFPMREYRQKSFEQFLGMQREDTMDGGALIPVFRRYTRQHQPEDLHLLRIHNQEDVYGLFPLLSLLAYNRLVEQGAFQIAEAGMTREEHPRLSVRIRLDHELPVSLQLLTEASGGAFLKNTDGLLEFPVHHGVLRHYFPDYRNYYYLPEEDTVIHKSIGKYVDSAHRSKATRENCFLSTETDYLQLKRFRKDSFLKRSLKDKDTYIDLTPWKESLQSGIAGLPADADPAFTDLLNRVICHWLSEYPEP
ncbi:ribonuclease H-like domain-containing protein [Clostridium sp. SY8519]|uniref:ribonuclease H-like domain-containing protein n=1 Tax=Clostridium sp. (strain SY8519) TaxID=1042156 RepID=UPI0005A2297D|nr:ribonuclease H-like domain-containing protein [Clostridium sp. SY8519]